MPSHFEPEAYLRANPDVASRNVDASQHFLACGRLEGRRLLPGSATVPITIEFDSKAYLLMNPDVAKTGQDPREHFLLSGQYEGRRLLPGPCSVPLTIEFDPEAYLLINPDVARAARDPREHFLSCGQYEGRKIRPRVISGRWPQADNLTPTPRSAAPPQGPGAAAVASVSPAVTDPLRSSIPHRHQVLVNAFVDAPAT